MHRFVSLGEIRLGLRLIAKQPILSATIILALATGICLATMGFTFRDALLNSRLPYAAGDRFGRLSAFNRDGRRLDFDLERYHAFRDRAASFAHVGAATGRTMTWVEAVPVLGRTLIPADGEPGAALVAAIRESLWRRRYAADPSIIGRAITIGGNAHTVVGIMPDSFVFPDSGEIWLPLDERTLGGTSTKPAPGVRIVAVLAPGVTFETANAEIAGW